MPSQRPSLAAVAALALLWAPAAHAQVSPEESARRMKPAEGLESTLWAAEPMVVNPTNIDIDSRGRVWVTEGLNYRLTHGNKSFKKVEGADKIKILEDTDGDGKADKVTVFADNIYPIPMGIAVEEKYDKAGKYLGARVFIGNSPDLLVLEDTDGDDKADRRYPLLTGFGGVDSDHGVHGMVLGLDGKLYFTHGDGCCSLQTDHSHHDQNFDVVDRSGRHVSSNQLANTLRVDRDGTNFEIIADRQRNNYETCMNSFGNIFTSDNDDDGNRGSRVIWVMEGGKYGYRTPGSPRHWGEDVPGNVPKLVGTGNGSPCGVMVYEGDLLPKEFRGAVLEAEAGPRYINYFPITRKGAAFRTEHKIMLKSDDPWFRPVDVTAAPDGSVFVADWYDGGVGGHNFQDQTTGRIYRVAPTGSKSKRITYDFTSIPGLIEALKSPVVATRDAARRGLIAHGRDAATAVGTLAHGDDPVMTARAMWVAQAILGDPAVLVAAMPGVVAEPAIVEQAARMLGRDLARVGKVEYTRPLADQEPPALKHMGVFNALAAHPDAGVRREVILALRNVSTGQAGAALKTLAASWDGKDRWYLEALGLALRDREPAFVAELFDGTLYGPMNVEDEAKVAPLALPPYFPVDRNEAFISASDPELPPANALSKTLGLAWELRRSETLPAIVEMLPKLGTPELQQAADDVIKQLNDPAGALALSALLSGGEIKDPARRRQVLSTLAKKIEGPWAAARENVAVVKVILDTLADPETRPQAIMLAAATGDPRYADTLVKVVGDTQAGVTSRTAAVEALGRIRPPGTAKLLEDLIAGARGGQPADLDAAEAAVRTLPKLGDARDRLQTLMAADDAPLGLRREALRTFAGLGGGSAKLLAMAADKTLPEALKTEATSVLYGSPDRTTRDQAAKVLPLTTASGKPLPSLYELVRREGNAQKGATIFFKAGATACGTCHRVQGQGQWVGPDLSTIGVKYDKKELLSNILSPSAAISYNYRTAVLALKDGQVVTGLPVEESADRIVLKTAEGKRITVRPAEVEARKVGEVSLMPEGLAQALGEQDLVDLLAYLGTLKQPVSIVGRAEVLAVAEGRDKPAIDPAAKFDASQRVGEASWRRVDADAEGRLDLAASTGADASKVVYMHTPVTSASGLTARLVIDAVGPVRAWLGGKEISLSEGTADAPRTATLTIPKGTGDLLIRASGPSLVATIVADRPVEFGAGEAKGSAR